MTRDYPMRVDVPVFKQISSNLSGILKDILQTETWGNSSRGFEGQAASSYFKCFDQMILQQRESFFFKTRNRRPPTDNVNDLTAAAPGRS